MIGSKRVKGLQRRQNVYKYDKGERIDTAEVIIVSLIELLELTSDFSELPNIQYLKDIMYLTNVIDLFLCENKHLCIYRK